MNIILVIFFFNVTNQQKYSLLIWATSPCGCTKTLSPTLSCPVSTRPTIENPDPELLKTSLIHNLNGLEIARSGGLNESKNKNV